MRPNETELVLLSDTNTTPPEQSDDPEPLTVRQIILAAGFSLIVVYLAFATVFFFQLPESRRSLSNFLVPFGSSETAMSLHKKGVKHYTSRRYGRALEAFNESLNQKPGNIKGIFLLGSSLIRLNRFEDGLEVLDKAESVAPDFSRIYIKRAYVQLGLGKFEKARKQADRYRSQSDIGDPNRVYAYLVEIAATELGGGPNSPDTKQLVTEARKLDVPDNSLPMQLLDLVAGEVSVDSLLKPTMDRGPETEVKAWGAVRALIDGNTSRARKLTQWVINKGDQDRYEYDLALALAASPGSN